MLIVKSIWLLFEGQTIRRRRRIRKEELYGNMKMSTLLSTVYVHLLLIEVLYIHVNLEKEEKLNLKKILRWIHVISNYCKYRGQCYNWATWGVQYTWLLRAINENITLCGLLSCCNDPQNNNNWVFLYDHWLN